LYEQPLSHNTFVTCMQVADTLLQ